VNIRMHGLTRRRQSLQALSEAQRNLIAAEAGAIVERVAGIDRAYVRVRELAVSPVAIVLGGAALLLIGPRRILRLAGRALFMFTAARRAVGFLRR
jgi:YqjK-like protein